MNYPIAVTASADNGGIIMCGWPTLSNQHRFSSDSYTQTRRYITSTSTKLYDLSMSSEQRFVGFHKNAASLGSIGISFVKVDCQNGYRIDMGSHEDLLLMQVLLRGSMNISQGRDKVSVRAGQVVMVDPLRPTRKLWQGSSEQIMISFERSRLEHILKRDAGVAVRAPLAFTTCNIVELRRLSTLWHYIQIVCQDLNGPDSHLCRGQASRVAERMLGMLVLQSLPNNYVSAFSGKTSSSIAPYYVRRAEEYIRTHAPNNDITIDELVAASRASARSLYYGFRAYRGTTPMGYVKEVRLDLARVALTQEREAGTTVTAVALDVGYTNLSQFSRDYRKRFLESPSQTLAGH